MQTLLASIVAAGCITTCSAASSSSRSSRFPISLAIALPILVVFIVLVAVLSVWKRKCAVRRTQVRAGVLPLAAQMALVEQQRNQYAPPMYNQPIYYGQMPPYAQTLAYGPPPPYFAPPSYPPYNLPGQAEKLPVVS